VEEAQAEAPVEAEEQAAQEQAAPEQSAPEQTEPEQPQASQPTPSPEKEAAAAAAKAKSEEGRRRAQERWERLVQAKESGETVEGTVTVAVKGGLLVDLQGFRGFLPASQVRVDKGTPIESLLKAKIPLRILDVDEARRRVVVSQRRALEAQRRAAREELLRSLRVGEEREATVMRLTDFGAFVDLGGIDALIPMNELAFERVEKAADVVTPGEKLQVRVLRVDAGGKKIAVSRKGALPDPWRDAGDVLRQGNVVEGKVVSKEPRLQVEVAPGVVGSISDREANPEDYEMGETVEVSIRSVDWRQRRLRLSTMHHATQSFSSTGFAPLGEELRSKR
jgi:small subunit ribosomal protein S1